MLAKDFRPIDISARSRASNRIDAEAHGKILGSVHARIPMVAIDEQRALQLQNAEADEKLWTSLQDMSAEQAEGSTFEGSRLTSKLSHRPEEKEPLLSQPWITSIPSGPRVTRSADIVT
jgi:hypothetical protein